MLGIFGILLALGLLIFFAYRGVSVLILAPLMALVAVLFNGGTPLLGAYTQIFMGATADFIMKYFPLFLLGAIFGKLMDDSGSAQAIARAIIARLGEQRAILAVVLSCAVLTYGGVSLFVVAFAVYPIAAALFRQADIPKRLIPATIALGAFTFTMTALPGTPAIQNAIPIPYFGTNAFASPVLGILTAMLMFGLGQWWLSYRLQKARAANEGYGHHDDAAPAALPEKRIREHAEGEGFDYMELEAQRPAENQFPNFWIAITPIVVVIFANLLFATQVIPRLETDYLGDPQYGATTISAVGGIWAIICALVVAIVVLLALNWKRLTDLRQTLDSGANASVLPIFNTASQVGFGAVIAALAAFELIRSGVLGIGGDNPLISLAVSVNVLAGITGSASGGMSIALQALGDHYVAMAQSAGISMELMHRVTAVATGGLDSLPHNGAIITLLAICKLTHRDSYGDIFVVALLIPLISLIFLIAAGTLIS
ncbi:GntP family permease [Thiorhodospira sibirica]|uniref:GntP family permease n=1 Tax=Thiorhodospira sibirica TaxID=154347 RepID=UPI00022C17D3|nr:GntP family permease [Thiorhodospira sibirica]